MPRPVALLNVDRTFFIEGGPLNQLLVDTLVGKGVLDVYLFTDVAITAESIKKHSALMRFLKEMGEPSDLKIHGVMTPNDLAWNEKSGSDPESSARLGAEAIGLIDLLQDRELPPLPKFQVSSDRRKDAVSGAYTFLGDSIFGQAQSSEATGFASPEAMVAAIRERAEARSAIGRLKKAVSVADSRFPGWHAVARGYQPLEQAPGCAFAEAAAAFDERMVARCDVSRVFADYFASSRHLRIKALMLDLLLHRTTWISSITVVDTPENIIENFHPISFDRDHALVPISWVAADMGTKLGPEGYAGPLQESLCKDHVMHICADIDVKILEVKKGLCAFDVAVLTSLKQAILADGDDDIERDLNSIIDLWAAKNAGSKEAYCQVFLTKLKDEYVADSLTRVRPSAPLTFKGFHEGVAGEVVGIAPAGSPQ